MRTKLFIIIFILFSSAASYSDIGDYGIDPLDQTGTARVLGMGGAYYGASGDLNCMFYNPAGIANSKGIMASVRSMKDFSIGLGYNTQIGGFGLGFVSKSYEDFQLETVKDTRYERSLAMISYGIGSSSLSFGITAKSLMTERLASSGPDITSSSGFDADTGIIWKPLDWASIGLGIRNVLAGKRSVSGTEESFPKSTRMGLALGVIGKDSYFTWDPYGLKLYYDIESKNAGNELIQNSFYGLEGTYYDWLFLRLGASSVFRYVSSSESGNISCNSFGVGYKIKDAMIDIASFKDPISENQLLYLSVVYSPPNFVMFQAPAAKQPDAKQARELLAISSPQDNYITYEEFVPITGIADPQGSVTINGVNVLVGEDGKFTAVQSLNPGKNLIEIESTIGLNKKLVERKVLRKAKIVIAEETGLNKKIIDEILNKEDELNKLQDQISKDRTKGIDVTAREVQLQKETEAYQIKKADIYKEKARLEERKQKVEDLVNVGVIEVAKDKKFEIEAKITRGEMLSWLAKASGITIPEKVENSVFSDVPANHKYATYIKAALDIGMIKKSADNKFRPDEPVTETEGQEFFKAFGVMK